MSVGNNSSHSQQGSGLPLEFVELLEKLQVARFSIFSFVFILGLWGNVMVIATICSTKKLRSPSNYFIANLAVADIGGLCVSMPIAIIGQVTDWPFGELVCRFLNPLKDLFLHVSFITLTAIAVDRYVHTAYPFKPHISIYKVKLIIALIWLVDYIMIPLPMGFVMKVEKNPFNGFDVCMTKFSPKWRRTSICLLAGFVFLSVFVTALAYLGVGVVMFKQRGRIKRRAQGQGSAMQEKAFRRQLEKNAKTVKLMVVIILAFWLTVLPLTFFGLLQELKVLNLTWSEYMITVFIVLHLLFLQHCINPIILYVLSKEIRAGMSSCAPCCWGSKKQQNAYQRRASSSQRQNSATMKPEDYPPVKQNGVSKIDSINNNDQGPIVQM